MINIIKNFLTNQIVINWIAPIITGLIVVVIPAISIRFFQIKKDKRKVDDANQRYLNSIRPYIIQKINIDKKFISDIRQVIIKESYIKEKYIYTELELRNKLILDITEDNYINEINKKELSDFTYEVFKGFVTEKKYENEVEKDSKHTLLVLDKTVVVLIVSLIICTIIQIKSGEKTDLNKNVTFGISYILAFLSMCLFFLSVIIDLLTSRISSELSLREKFKKLFFEEIEVKEKPKQKSKQKINKMQ